MAYVADLLACLSAIVLRILCHPGACSFTTPTKASIRKSILESIAISSHTLRSSMGLASLNSRPPNALHDDYQENIEFGPST
ncbi:uncharacterized protein K460DRAFT_60060 [Cucurbitaria berberidis CBS 394.84]|uniref:Secreted protein n=1 Tax=Cucurbitaria berberidis CBS 394.84 TaxID=1168544 RepID=A0A9P4GLH4_9PLEO|nr:uncharacterized protein K460DRAFT_60060 [Cucurbitaria berberidis CBS 394.84]KAF1847531.1 hypothetical protein K460DRAFT_60060 [Cucurbitaria berberidis CBS 394.84]